VKKATDWIKSKTTVNQQNLLNSIAYNAVLFIEQRYKDLEGNGKFSEAVQHVVQVLAQKGFNIDIAAIQAAVQAAYEDAKKNGLITVIPTPTPNTNSTLVTRPEPIPQA
jgi:GH35 family endo-1,4-beta-xylanase